MDFFIDDLSLFAPEQESGFKHYFCMLIPEPDLNIEGVNKNKGIRISKKHFKKSRFNRQGFLIHVFDRICISYKYAWPFYIATDRV